MNAVFRFFAILVLQCIIFLSLVHTPVNAAGYMQGTARWEQMPGAAGYHIYYRENGETKYNYAVPNLSSTTTSYMIRYLKPGVRYWYNVVAVDGSGKELQWSGLKKLRVAWMP